MHGTQEGNNNKKCKCINISFRQADNKMHGDKPVPYFINKKGRRFNKI